MKELIDSYYDVLELHNKWGKIMYTLKVSPEVYSMVESSEIFDDRFFMPSDQMYGYEFLEMPHGC